MKRLLMYVMKVFYANENYAKYGVRGMNYFMALIMTSFYIMLTGCMILFILMTAFPAFYKYDLSISSKIPSMPSAIVTLGSLLLLLRITVKEESQKVNKSVNFLLGYAFATVVIVGFLGLKFLRHYQGHV